MVVVIYEVRGSSLPVPSTRRWSVSFTVGTLGLPKWNKHLFACRALYTSGKAPFFHLFIPSVCRNRLIMVGECQGKRNYYVVGACPRKGSLVPAYLYPRCVSYRLIMVGILGEK